MGRVALSTVIAAMLACTAALSDAATGDPCPASWERAQQIRVELGLQSEVEPMPDDPLRPRKACEMILAAPEDALRDVIKESIRICGGDCRRLLKESGK